MYEETDGVATGSLLGRLLANASVCSIEERMEQEGKMLHTTGDLLMTH